MRLMDRKVESKEGVLVATVAGWVSSSEAISVFTKACDVAAERGFDQILVDCLSVEGELIKTLSFDASFRAMRRMWRPLMAIYIYNLRARSARVS